MADLICPVAHWAEENPDNTAIWQSHQPVRYRELNCVVAGAEDSLLRSGIAAGDRVAVRLATSLDFIAIFIALNRIGATSVLISLREPKTAVEQLATSLTCSALVLDDDKEMTSFGGKVINVSEIMRSTAPAKRGYRTIASETPAAALFTSGSVGKPKAALLSYGSIYYNALGSNENIPFGPDDRWLIGLPLYHVGGIGILYRAFIGGGSVVLPEPSFDLVRQIAMQQVTHISVVNKQLYGLVNRASCPADFHSLKAALVGGSAISSTLINQALNAGFPIHTSYGLTEMASQVTTTSAADRPDKMTTSGRPLAYRQVKVADGEILVRGECLFQGYLTGTGIERASGINDWFGTRDLGTIDAEGYLTVLGRKDNMFISGGENIQPEEIERILLNLNHVQDAVVVPVEDEEYGERPVAFVQMSQEALLDEEGTKNAIREFLPGFKTPTRVFPFPSTENATGMKCSRKELRALAVQLLSNRR